MNIDNPFYSSLVDRLRNVEIELAEKKLALSEALFENEHLSRQLRHQSTSMQRTDSDPMTFSTLSSNDASSSVSWISKTVNTIKEATTANNRAKVN